MNARTVSGGELTPEQRRVLRVEHILRRDGGSPGSALEGLEAIVADETWRKVPRGSEDERPFVSFLHFVETAAPFGLGYPREQLVALLKLKHPEENRGEMRERMDRLRTRVTEMLNADIAPARTVGRPENCSPSNGSGTTFSSGRGADYLTARLKRDHPGLAERVVAGELTASAAARQAGILRPRILITSPQAIAKALRKHMDQADLARLAALLADGDREP